MKMVSNQNSTRINTTKLKAMIIHKIGHQRAEKYFNHITRLFASKISKCEFDSLCLNTVGRENIPLHNRLIRSIIKNACLSRSPPARGGSKSGGTLKKGARSLCRDAPKFREEEEQQSPTELLSLGSRPSVEEGEEVEQSPSVQSRSPVTAPLGITLCGARKALSNGSSVNTFDLQTCENSGELPDTKTLRTRLEKKLEREGLRPSMDCVNLLNNGLDAYLKRLIEPCLGLKSACVSVLDFRVAMEMNPRLLGEDWPVQLEKISSQDISPAKHGMRL